MSEMIVADSMLGKLSRYLRMLGYDVEYIENDKDDSYVVNNSLGKIVLTRDKLLHERIKSSILLKSYDPLKQLEELRGRLPPPDHKLFETCSACGSFLKKIKGDLDLPDYVSKQAAEVFYCKKCDKYYWEGSHTQNFRRLMESIGIEVQ